tara:strand:- start:205 stop:339 length:135 start_codon:yes stop_codon:yes gene_type:complete
MPLATALKQLRRVVRRITPHQLLYNLQPTGCDPVEARKSISTSR